MREPLVLQPAAGRGWVSDSRGVGFSSLRPLLV